MADKKLQPDGKQSSADDIEGHPDFQTEYLKMTDEHFKKENPGYHALMQRIKDGNKAPAKKD